MKTEKYSAECKNLMVKEIKQKLEKYSDFFITSFNKISVAEQDQLRHRLKKNNAALLIVKNRIANHAFKKMKREELFTLLQGPTAIAFSQSDPPISKTLIEFANKNENFKINGAYVSGQLLDMASVKKLASIPSREALIAQVLAGLNSPIQGLVNTLSATIKGIVVVLDKIREKKQ